MSNQLIKNIHGNCPMCDSPSLFLQSYDPLLPILKRREWRLCSNCKNYSEEVTDYNKRIFTI